MQSAVFTNRAVSRRHLTAETRVQTQASTCNTRCEQMAVTTGSFPEQVCPLSTGNTFQDLPRLRETADNTAR
jgi:hypothetical protein